MWCITPTRTIFRQPDIKSLTLSVVPAFQPASRFDPRTQPTCAGTRHAHTESGPDPVRPRVSLPFQSDACWKPVFRPASGRSLWIGVKPGQLGTALDPRGRSDHGFGNHFKPAIRAGIEQLQLTARLNRLRTIVDETQSTQQASVLDPFGALIRATAPQPLAHGTFSHATPSRSATTPICARRIRCWILFSCVRRRNREPSRNRRAGALTGNVASLQVQPPSHSVLLFPRQVPRSLSAAHCRIMKGSAPPVIAGGETPLQGQGRTGMATTDVSLHAESRPPEQKRVVNDMSIQVATVNGSGSQSSNTVLLRSIFQMGVPVSGKNLFPSNIAGLPTWYTIRANKDGYIARKKEIDFVVAMNSETAQRRCDVGGRRRCRSVRRAFESQHVCAPIWFSTPFPTTSWSRRSVPRPSCASWSRT